jgi:hypothetical protein
MGEVIPFRKFQSRARIGELERTWYKAYQPLDRLELLRQMVRYQVDRARETSLSPTLIARGLALFKLLFRQAETYEFKLMANSFLRHLEYERTQFLK